MDPKDLNTLIAEAQEKLPKILPGIDVDDLGCNSGGRVYPESDSTSYVWSLHQWFRPLTGWFGGKEQKWSWRESRVLVSNIGWNGRINETAVIDMHDIDVFTDQVVIDLGAGEYDCGYLDAVFDGARAYIAVEQHNYLDLRGVLSSFHEALEEHGMRPIPFIVVPERLETFVQRLPQESVSYIMSGLCDVADRACFDAQEDIRRTLHSHGCIVSKNSITPAGEGLQSYPLDFEWRVRRGERIDSLYGLLTVRQELTDEDSARAYFCPDGC